MSLVFLKATSTYFSAVIQGQKRSHNRYFVENTLTRIVHRQDTHKSLNKHKQNCIKFLNLSHIEQSFQKYKYTHHNALIVKQKKILPISRNAGIEVDKIAVNTIVIEVDKS